MLSRITVVTRAAYVDLSDGLVLLATRLPIALATVLVGLFVPVLAASAATPFGTVDSGGPIDGAPTNCVIPIAQTTVTCTIFQRVANPSDHASGGLTAPISGVLTSWHASIGVAGVMTATPRVISASGFPVEYTAKRSGIPRALVNTLSGAFDFPERLAVAAGDRIGLDITTAGSPGQGPYTLQSSTGGVYVSLAPQLNDGSTYTPPAIIAVQNSKLILSATVEPDADNDGFGDETQDSCPADPATQVACLLAPQLTNPVNKGTTLTFTSTQPGTVRTTIERIKVGRKQKGKCSSKPKRGKRCKIYKRVFTLDSPIVAGANTINYKTKVGGKRLKSGKYRVTLLATNATGASATTQFNFTVKRSKKK